MKETYGANSGAVITGGTVEQITINNYNSKSEDLNFEISNNLPKVYMSAYYPFDRWISDIRIKINNSGFDIQDINELKLTKDNVKNAERILVMLSPAYLKSCRCLYEMDYLVSNESSEKQIYFVVPEDLQKDRMSFHKEELFKILSPFLVDSELLDASLLFSSTGGDFILTDFDRLFDCLYECIECSDNKSVIRMSNDRRDCIRQYEAIVEKIKRYFEKNN